LKWEGVYNHCDSYPIGLGQEVWKIASDEKNLGLLCERLLQHGSWSSFLTRDDQEDLDHITSENPDPLFVEWVYIIDPERNMLHVLKNESVGNRLDFSKRSIGPVKLPGRVVDYGHCSYKYVLVASLKLDGPEPDWSKLGCEEEPEED
jgi:hypothetical protein